MCKCTFDALVRASERIIGLLSFALSFSVAIVKHVAPSCIYQVGLVMIHTYDNSLLK